MNKFYITRGVKEKLDDVVVSILFNLREAIPVRDYLTIINMVPINEVSCQIKVSQEIPNFKMTKVIQYKLEHEIKLYIIDEGNYRTCLLAEEY